MAGKDPSGEFVAADFRATIRATMTMGLPDDVDLRPTFHFPSDDTYLSASRSGMPWDWLATPVANDPDITPIQVPCTVAVAGTTLTLNAVAEFNPQTAVLGLCDVDYEAVKGFSEVTILGATYRYSKLESADSLFDYTLFNVAVIAKDVS